MEEKKCNTCGKKLSITEIWASIFGFYVMGAAIYGTIELVKKLISLF
jgi:hypothetical protein